MTHMLTAANTFIQPMAQYVNRFYLFLCKTSGQETHEVRMIYQYVIIHTSFFSILYFSILKALYSKLINTKLLVSF